MVRHDDATKWYRNLNAGIATAYVLNMIPFCVAIWQKEYNKITMTMERNNTIIGVGAARFNLAAAFLTSSLLCAACHAWVACSPSNVVRCVLSGTNPYRWGMLLISLPTLQVAMLFGVAAVSEVWAFYASALLSMAMLTILYYAEQSKGPSTWSLLMISSFYVTFWSFAWWTGDRRNPIALACLCTLIVGLLLVFLLVRPKKKRGFIYREAFLTISTTSLQMGAMWLWFASQSKTFDLAPWSAFCSIVLVTAAFSVYQIEKIKAISFDTHHASATNVPLIDDEEEAIVLESKAGPYMEPDIGESHTVPEGAPTNAFVYAGVASSDPNA
jgi:hypothetical protein